MQNLLNKKENFKISHFFLFNIGIIYYFLKIIEKNINVVLLLYQDSDSHHGVNIFKKRQWKYFDILINWCQEPMKA
jgi:hypothetical protein